MLAGMLQQLFLETAARRKQVLGGEHPDTLRSRSSLANSYLAAGRVKEVVALHSNVGRPRASSGRGTPRTHSSRVRLAAAQLAAKEAAESDTGHHKQRRFASLVVCEI